jgi:hypothetical protein
VADALKCFFTTNMDAFSFAVAFGAALWLPQNECYPQ